MLVLYGYTEHQYPLVVFPGNSTNKLNAAYDQSFGPYTGLQSFRLYGQWESADFNGATLIVEFSDGTYAKAQIERLYDSNVSASAT
jgi:hypothetical protein